MSKDTHVPEPVDIHVGERIRARRRIVGVSQQALAEKIGLTFQQVQKYERGANRVSASKLYEIAAALGCGIGFFFDGLQDPARGGDSEAVAEWERRASAFFAEPYAFELAKIYAALPGNFQTSLISVARSLEHLAEPKAA